MAVCDRCGEANLDSARFCSSCGAPLAERVHEGLEVRKVVTILFCDVVGSTSLGEATDPETTRRVMARYAMAMTEVIEQYGGTVERFRGDEVMAVFGIPAAHEDDALRAARAATEMQRRLAELNVELRARWGVELACRIGINTGEVVAGDPGTGETFVTGDAVNLAKRLEQAAEPGTILIGTATYPLVKDAVKVGPRERFSAKGKSGPVARFRLDEVDASAAGYARRLDAPLVGRNEELGRLLALVNEAFAERVARIVTVLGPAGIGKSRLAQELATELDAVADVVAGRCLPYGSGITFWPLVELVADLGGIEAASALLDGAEDGDVVVERLRAAIGAGDMGAPSTEVFWAVRRLLERMSERRPLLVILDDLHWAEPTMLDLIEYVAAFGKGPLVLLCIARPDLFDTRPSFAADRLELEQLSDMEIAELVETLGVEDPDLRGRITSTSEGNPLFAEQLAAMVADSGHTGSIELPASIHALLAARIDGLEPAERRTLERACVVGKEFWHRAIVGLSSPADQPFVTGRLMALIRKGLVTPSRSELPGEDTYRFRHSLICDETYAGMPKAVRAELHEQFARWLQLQAREGRGFGEHDEILGYHLEQAYRCRTELVPDDEPAQALAAEAGVLLEGAGRRAAARDDIPAAIALLERTDALMTDASPSRGGVRHALGRGLWEIGENERALGVLEAAIEDAARATDVRSEWLARLDRAAFRLVLGVGDELRDVAEEAVGVLSSMDDNDAALALAWRRMAFADRREGRYGASVEPSERALEHARAAGDAYEETRAIDSLCTGLLYGPTPASEAAERCREVLADAGGRPATQANVLASLAELEAMLGRFDAAHEAYSRARAIYEELGLRMPLAGLTTIGAELELLAGDGAAAEAEARRGMDVLEGTGLEVELLPLVAEALLAQEREDDAEAVLSGLADDAHGVPWRVRVRTARARLLARRGKADDALAEAQDAVGRAAVLDDVNLSADAYAALADVLECAGRMDDAWAARDDAYARYMLKGNVAAAEAIVASRRA